jgi:hypothetical protein
MSKKPVSRPKVKLPILHAGKPRNPVQRALMAKTLAVGAGKHEKSAVAKRQAAKQQLRQEMTAAQSLKRVP